jgi:hypothetical protein
MQPQTLFFIKEMMEDFEKFIAFAKWLGAGFPGICRIIPYESYCPNAAKYEDTNDIVNFEEPLNQFVRDKNNNADVSVLDFSSVGTICTLQTFFEYTQAKYVPI